jgi:hypothetical protein
MTAKELQKRGAKAELLRVLQTEDGSFYAESAEGKILYRVIADDQETSCTCADFTRNSKKDPDFQCKHILSVLNCVPTGDVEPAQYLERKKPKLDDRWVIEIEGNQFVKYAGLLDLGHQKGISQIEVEPLQLPTKENGNSAICKATVISKSGESFTDIGDANPGNCSSKVVKHLLRLASTRAIARSLRTFTNIGMTCLEELADLNDVIGNGPKTSSKPKATKQPTRKPQVTEDTGKAAEDAGKNDAKTDSSTNKKTGKKSQPAKKESKAAGKTESKSEGNDGNNSGQPAMSEAQKRAIYNLSRRRGISVEDLEQMSMDAYNVAVENLTSKDASAFIRNLQQAA